MEKINRTLFILIFSFLIFSSCSNNNISNSDVSDNLNKPTDIFSINSSTPGLEDYIPPWYPKPLIIPGKVKLPEFTDNLCFILWLIGDDKKTDKNDSKMLNDSYDFRDNFLTKSEKGIDYIYAYYILSEYGIKNNLVINHSLEHVKLINTGIQISQELQNGTDEDSVLIDKSIYNDCKNIVKVYRESENHQKIDLVLDYLENDLERFYNKTKAEIAIEFE